ncbi:unnamed protein product [Sphagnum tenellum]
MTREFLFPRHNWHNVSFPSLTICNVNQARKSFFKAHDHYPANARDLDDPLRPLFEAMFSGEGPHPPTAEQEKLINSFINNADIVKEGNKAYDMYHNRATIRDTLNGASKEALDPSLDFVRLAAMQKIGEMSALLVARRICNFEFVLGQSTILSISYQGRSKPIDEFAVFHPFFDTDFGFCTYIRPDIMFAFSNTSFHDLLKLPEEHVVDQSDEIRLGTEHGLKILLDAEVRQEECTVMGMLKRIFFFVQTFDYGYSPSNSEGFRVSIQHNFDFPIVQFSTVDISPGFNSRLAVKPTLTSTKDTAIDRFFARASQVPPRLRATLAKIGMDCNCQRGAGEFNRRHKHGDERDQISWHICYRKELACYHENFRKLGQLDFIEDKDGNKQLCMAACFDQTYEVSLTQSSFPNWNGLMTNTTFFCLVYRKVRAICNDEHRREALIET